MMAATRAENSIAGRKITGWTLPVSSLDDKPKMTAAALKAAFDANTNQIKPALNGLIDDLLSTDGAGNIGTRAISGVSGTTVQTMLAALKALIDLRETTANVDSKLSTKADKTTVAGMVKSISFNAQTGTFTITEQGGTVHIIDTVLEKVPMSCKLDGQDFVLTLEDGTEQRASLAAFLTPNEFTDSETVKFSVVGNTVTADIKPGSITLNMLGNTLRNWFDTLKTVCQTAASNAAASAQNAAQHKTDAAASQTAAAGSASEAAGQATLAKSWATGGTGIRVNENSDNSRFYAGIAVDAATAAGNQAAGASRSAADAANSAEQAAAEVTKAQTEAERAKSEADRAKEIVGGDYATRGELTAHNTAADAHEDIRRAAGEAKTALENHNTSTVAHMGIQQKIDDHIADKDNPHELTAEQLGALLKTGGVITGDVRIGGRYKVAKLIIDGDDGWHEVNGQDDEKISNMPATIQRVNGFPIAACTLDEYGNLESSSGRGEPCLNIYNVPVMLNCDLFFSGLHSIHCVKVPVYDADAANKWYVDRFVPQVFTATIPATNAGATGSVAGTFPACTASETDCIVDAAPAAASWDKFYDCNFRLKSISPTGFTYTVDSNLTSPMTVYITVQKAVQGT